MVKIYELTRFDGMQLRVSYAGMVLNIEFKGGDLRHRARYTTNNQFVQDAIEHDHRFGGLIVLRHQYENTPEGKAKADQKAKKKIARVKTVNDALRVLTEYGFNPTGENDLDDLMEKAGLEFPNLKR